VADAEDKIKEEEEKAQQQVDEAGDKAKADAEAKGLTPEEVQEQVEKARKEEKDKLYPQLKELKDNMKAIQEVLAAERADKERIQKDAEKKAEDERKSKLSDQEKTLEAINKLEEQLNNERKERERLQRDLQKREEQNKLDTYRNRLIEQNKDKIIPELVTGKTVEELDNSLEVAKARFTELAERFKNERSETTRKNMPGPTNPDLEALDELELSKDLTQLDQDKYLSDPAYREKIQNQLADEYGRLAGRR